MLTKEVTDINKEDYFEDSFSVKLTDISNNLE